jgi:hypothetical protein
MSDDSGQDRGNPLETGSGGTSPALVAVYLIILGWAALAWNCPGGP